MNALIAGDAVRTALLALEDGTTYVGRSCGALGEVFGEVVFNTSMVGYQEIVTDPSYAGQIVTLTYPQVGNYGVSGRYMQSQGSALRGLVVHDMCYTPSNWQSEGTFPDFLDAQGVVAIEGIDTRALTLKIRGSGAMRAAISTVDLNPQSLVARVCQSPEISAHNFVADVSPKQERIVRPEGWACGKRVVAYDCGMKAGIEEELLRVGSEVVVVPFDTPAARTLALEPDGVFFSNGPGDPTQVVSTAHAVRDLLGKVPIFGICLGNQLIAMAGGSEIEKLPFGHHGGNEPVMNLLTHKVEITAQNHNYGLVFSSMGELVPELSGGFDCHVRDLREWVRRGIAPVVQTTEHGRVRLTHVNLNDGTPEGIQYLDLPAFSVQYHPESRPGPHDSHYLFTSFMRLMGEWAEGKGGTYECSDYVAIDVREGRVEDAQA